MVARASGSGSWCKRGVVIISFLTIMIMMYEDHMLSFSSYSTNSSHSATNNIASMSEVNVSATFQPKQWSYVYLQRTRKTGGTSISSILGHNTELTANASKGRVLSTSQDQNTPFRVIKGRAVKLKNRLIANEYFPFYTMSFLKHYEELWSDVLLITIIRDPNHPINRIYSDLLYQGSWKCSNIKYARLSGYNMSELEKQLIICARNQHAKHSSNVYCKVYSGVWPYANPNKRLIQRGVDFNPNISITRIHYELALLIIQQFDVIIITELFEETIPQLKCNGLMNDTVSHKNTGKAKKRYPLESFATLKQELIKLNYFDLKFYEHAKRIAWKHVDQCKTK